MSRTNYTAASIYKEIKDLLILLKDLKGSKINIVGLDSLETTLNKKNINQNEWSLHSKLVFKNLNIKDFNIPKKIRNELIEVDLELVIDITETNCTNKEIKDTIKQNDNTKYNIQLIVYGRVKDSKRKYKMSWHLDKHIRSENDGDGKGFSHPEYHLNMGGFALTNEEGFDFGNILLIDTPRVMQPPLDIVLSIDFVLRNFYGNRAKNLIRHNPYKRIINSSKYRLWRPYFASLASEYYPNAFSHLDIEKGYASKIYGY